MKLFALQMLSAYLQDSFLSLRFLYIWCIGTYLQPELKIFQCIAVHPSTLMILMARWLFPGASRSCFIYWLRTHLLTAAVGQ